MDSALGYGIDSCLSPQKLILGDMDILCYSRRRKCSRLAFFRRKRSQQLTADPTHVTLIPRASIPDEGNWRQLSKQWLLNMWRQHLCSANADPTSYPLPTFDIAIERIGPHSVLPARDSDLI